MTPRTLIEPPGVALLRPTAVAENDLLRSRVMRAIIDVSQPSVSSSPSRTPGRAPSTPPPRLVQFWDTRTIPADVRECLDTWRPIEAHGIKRVLFNDEQARRYIARRYGSPYSMAYERCLHPAMKSDYFRLCFMVREGGMYIDADDVYLRRDPEFLLCDGALRVQALCFDRETDSMVSSSRFAGQAQADSWTFYVNNNPLIAPARHPILRLALSRATRALLTQKEDWPDVQSTTGPGNLTACLVRHARSGRACGLSPAVYCGLTGPWIEV